MLKNLLNPSRFRRLSDSRPTDCGLMADGSSERRLFDAEGSSVVWNGMLYGAVLGYAPSWAQDRCEAPSRDCSSKDCRSVGGGNCRDGQCRDIRDSRGGGSYPSLTRSRGDTWSQKMDLGVAREFSSWMPPAGSPRRQRSRRSRGPGRRLVAGRSPRLRGLPEIRRLDRIAGTIRLHAG